MAELRVQAILERTSFDTAISDLEKKINALNGTKIIISVDNGSLSNAATSVAQLNTDAANMATSFTNAANAVGQMGSNAQRAGQQMSQTQTQLRNMAAAGFAPEGQPWHHTWWRRALLPKAAPPPKAAPFPRGSGLARRIIPWPGRCSRGDGTRN